MISSPIRVYLDCSDFSDLSDLQNLENSSDLKNTLNFLIEYQEKKIIEIPLSIVHITEIIHTKYKYQHSAIKRAKIIKKLCKENIIISLDKVILLEALNLLSTKLRINYEFKYPRDVFKDDGIWFIQEPIDSIKNAFNDMKLIFNKEFKNVPITRVHRKLIKKRLMNYKEFKIFIDIDSLLDFVLGKTNIEAPLNKTVSNLADIEKFIIGFLKDDGSNNFLNRLREWSQTIVEMMDKFRNKIELEHNVLNKKEIKRKKVEISKMFAKNLSSRNNTNFLEMIYRNNLSFLKKIGISRMAWETYILKAEFGSFPAIDLFNLLINQFVIEKGFNLKEKLSHSDGMDIMHCCYMPYCDVFRVDKRTAELLKKIPTDKLNINTEIVRNIIDLPEIIKKIEKSRSNTKLN